MRKCFALTNNAAEKTSTFTYDNCFWSFRNTDKEYKSTVKFIYYFISQEDVFNDIGHDLLDDVFMGYNACIFAYGQTALITAGNTELQLQRDSQCVHTRECHLLICNYQS
ncbi:hypothetical protein D917_02905 [Trichinella nativa]|uniref:Kinesin motor domain-containing protein n=1 Tax=Trichinella nativa TaxID=6335 RepID=A0A1Y3EH73_9BILA|nr:hypothetical protein D917_02905 [Trichinella nativa]